MKYKISTGLQKSFKNTAVTYILPAILVLTNSYADWMPFQYTIYVAPILGYIGYLIKNYIENH